MGIPHRRRRYRLRRSSNCCQKGCRALPRRSYGPPNDCAEWYVSRTCVIAIIN
eukprot:m.9931 g.9931  ORF g.9931 m.9931 type:complete len:53 (+) comp21744_c0_seq3:319-477(+)